VPDRVHANHEYTEYPMTGAGQFGGNPYGRALQPEPEPEAPESAPEPEPESEPVDPGLLMSFLTDFRSAQYEEIRRKRMEELEKSKKGRSHRPAPQVEDEDPYLETEAVPEDQAADWSAPVIDYPPQAPPPAHDLSGSAPGDPYPVNDADFQVAACKPEEPAGKRRFPLGLPSFKGLGQVTGNRLI
jgi:hypothetical protein